MFITGKYRAAPVASEDGMDVQVAVDAYGRVLTSTGTPPVGGGLTATDKTVTSATGSSQTLAAAAATRKAILIKNGNSNTGINLLGGTAAIGGAGTITLAPLEGLYLEGAVCPVGAITAISTAAAYISAIEYT